MKTSVVLLILILFNTTALLSEALAHLVKGINPWLLIGLEILLIIGYFFNKTIKEIRKTIDFDCNDLSIMITKYKK
ncbi:hypothetical protein UMM65_04950 [Aureibaculum sp. 2210JD6-5]|uniref:hypothetical protein n=1 Tax=Aureibaculum sp. 2210JD6-5 TaxID=3103957 RepID=UPI002AAD99BC|nr:hypothetical protein [Aureibaculum sp. 2210JD6-5]MDY7394578.1 hypothetical protein [Aureibaculum sp. 2210JD6-5]